MAHVTNLNSRAWLINPENIAERSALLRLPTRKWKQMLGVVQVSKSTANARAMREEIREGQLRFLPEFEAELEHMLGPSRQARQFPTWYKFKNDPHPPLPHQIEALKELYPTDTPAALMEMGTSKTRVAVDLMAAHFSEQRIQFVIVICPVTVKLATWEKELAQRCPCPYDYIDVGSGFKANNLRLRPDRLTWLIVGVESLSQGKTHQALYPMTTRGAKYAVIADESTRLANHEAICHRAAVALRANASLAMIMTGNEIEQSLEDVYGQFEFLDPHIIGCGDFFSFRNRYCMMGGYKNKQVIGYNHLDELLGLIAPHVYQCDKSVIKLPPKLYQQRIVEMAPAQKIAYKRMKDGLIEGNSVANTLTKVLRLSQIASGFYNTDGWVKNPIDGKRIKIPVATVEIVPPAQNPKLRELLLLTGQFRHPAIIWTSNRYEFKIVFEALSKIGTVLCLTGDTLREDRRMIVDSFQEGKTDFMIANPAAGGIGITLTAANIEVFFSNSMRLGHRIQAEDRAHRQGQEKSVTIIDLMVKGTVERAIWRNLSEKLDLSAYFKIALHDKKAMDQFMIGEVDEAVMERAKQLSEETIEGVLEGIAWDEDVTA